MTPSAMACSQHRLDDPEPVLHADLAPAVPAEHRGRVDEHDPLHRRRRALLQEQSGADAHRLQLRGGVRRGDARHDRGDHIAFDVFVDGVEQARLVAELVIQRAPRDAGGVDDRLGRHGGESVGGEQPRGRASSSRARVAAVRSAWVRAVPACR